MSDTSTSTIEISLALGEVVLDTSLSPPFRKTALQGKEVALLPLDVLRDAGSLYAISHGGPEKERVWAYMGYGPFETVDAMVGFFEERERSDDSMFFTVTESSTEKPVGVVSMLNFDRSARRLELGHIWYAISYHRGRTNTEAIYLMLREAFDHLGCRRVEWKCDALNQQSWKAAERLGFQHEGIFRQHRIIKGRNRDTAWFSILDSDWPLVRQALERWLDWGEGKPPSLANLRGEAAADL